MAWIIDNPLTYFQKFCVNILKGGPVPKHIAFIMDGNRRYARKSKLQKKEGHTRGFDKLAETLQWCLELGINEVTVYAFSIENFKRSPKEVDEIMQLAREKYKLLMEEKERLMADGVCIRIIGNLSLVPADLHKSIAEAMLMTKDNTKAFLNVAFSYTSREEIANAVKTVVAGVERNALQIDDVDEQLLTACLYTNRSPNPDIIVRTSGEVRFSDFLLWQIWNTNVCFTEVLWPDFSIWHLLASIFQYQRCCRELKSVQCPDDLPYNKSARIEQFLKDLEEERWATLHKYANS